MNATSLEMANNIANSPVAYLILFIALLWYILKTSQEREFKMREQLDKIVPILDNLVNKVNYIEEELKNKGDK